MLLCKMEVWKENRKKRMRLYTLMSRLDFFMILKETLLISILMIII